MLETTFTATTTTSTGTVATAAITINDYSANQEKQAALLAALQNLLGERGVLLDPIECEKYCKGARYGEGKAVAVLRPNSHEQVVELVRLCVDAQQALLMQGANTGLVAGSTPDTSASVFVVSLERLKQHIVIDAVNRSVEVDAGVCLQELNDALLPHGLFFPIDLAANPSIGGMIATNTGGAKLIKYGDVRQNLLGLRAVLLEPAGAVLDLQTALRKNNTGPDLKQLFVGSSGAFGIITRAVLQLHHLPKQTATALIVPRDQTAVLEILRIFERDCGEFLSAFEGISGTALQAVLRHIPDMQNPFAPEACPDYCILLELCSSASQDISGIVLDDLMMRMLEPLLDQEVQNAVIGRGKDLWRIRHSVSEALRHEGKMIAFDISMPRSALVEFRVEATTFLQCNYPWIKCMDFGHWADGGCHFNLVWPADAKMTFDASVVQELRQQIYDLVVHKYHGSFSAEHGVGPYNRDFYQRYTSDVAKHLAGKIQLLLDPQRLSGLTWFGGV
ncbi:FAD-binding oxidoreductase [Undibacterium flavidum]|uniref:FAD-binding oxidoreductase n=1 Tax=Undibacterium flavidum TaxID=2762297 RepID=A0ABR6Y6G9_9BURK|nr:FAD-binding oxidoreductase [Undibacterium flavidum]MBC3872168.1 FAD-binding oxidoreductase [Undibacterium flavidum]